MFFKSKPTCPVEIARMKREKEMAMNDDMAPIEGHMDSMGVKEELTACQKQAAKPKLLRFFTKSRCPKEIAKEQMMMGEPNPMLNGMSEAAMEPPMNTSSVEVLVNADEPLANADEPLANADEPLANAEVAEEKLGREIKEEASDRPRFWPTIKNAPVVIFSKSYCPHCKSAKDLIRGFGVKLHVVELDLLEEGADLQAFLGEKIGSSSVPSIWINQRFIGGNSDLQALHQAGKIEPALKN